MPYFTRGQSADDIYQLLNLGSKMSVTAESGATTDRNRTFDKVIEAFENYFEPRSNYRHYGI